ncbi:MAG: threonine/serine exporter family protein [Flavobacteriales bacterium]|nr:threonine/serine exporter family protein [Flavobacteriales bacterium]
MSPDPTAVHARRDTLLRFLGRLGQAQLNAGNAVPLVERDLAAIAKVNGEQQVQVFVLPTVLFMKWESGDEHRVDMAHGAYRVAPLRFDQIEEVLTIARSARKGEITPEEGLQRIDAMWSTPHYYGDVGFVAGYLMTTLGVSIMLRPSLTGLWLTTLMAFACALVLVFARRRPAWSTVLPVVVAFLLSAAVALSYRYGLKEPAMSLLIPPLITFLPGMMLTVSVIELAYNSIISGASRMVAGFTRLILLAFGIIGGFKAFHTTSASLNLAEGERIGPHWPWLGVLIFTLGLHIYQSSKRRSFGWMLITAAMAYAGQYLSGMFIQGASAAFFGAALMTITALVIEFRFKGPPAIVTFLPGFWLLAPGSFGLVSVASMASGQDGGGAIFTLLFALAGIATGCLIGAYTYSSLLHPRSKAAWWKPDAM